MIKFTSLWDDVRSSIADYTPLELLGYFRVANWFVSNSGNRCCGKIDITITSGICNVVNDVFEAMKILPDYRAGKICSILKREYCEEPLSTAEKISLADVSRTTYYAYLKEGEHLFTQICVSLMKDDKYSELHESCSICGNNDDSHSITKNGGCYEHEE